MSELEPQRAAPPPEDSSPSKPSPPEPWSAGWSWFVRLLGAAIMAQQAFFEQQDRQWLLLCAMGMMLGEIGLKAALRVLLARVGGQ